MEVGSRKLEAIYWKLEAGKRKLEDGSVGSVTDFRAGDPGSIPGQGRRFFGRLLLNFVRLSVRLY